MLNETVFRSEDVPAADRLSYWAERMEQTHAPIHLSSDHAHDFRAVQRVLDLGAVSVWPATIPQVVMRRTPRLIRQSDPELYHLSFVVAGTGTGRWGDHEVVYRPSDLVINDSSLPWEIRGGRASVTTVGAEIPKALLPLPRGGARRTVPRRLPTRSGIGALLAQFLLRLSADTTPYQPSDGPRLGTVLTDLVTALLAHTLETDSALPPDTRRRTLMLRIKRFIQEHLHDPGLSPAVIAAAHHISLSYLHRLFQHEEATVAAWIRRRRLEAACRDLTDPALHSTPVHAIATRRGFSCAADFSRAFRNAYGTPPKDYRRHALVAGKSTAG
ncbi:helix-turn-helix domain-containing protein [Streptomyces sp. NPDC058989]|uniref:AraC-like ligand-binding domain-containing protein n=1 Tax=Streptomyces sp. NPDC058989 TaxID=3346686 RepID=UPI0036A27739